MLLYLDASTLQEILADVSAIVFNCVLIDELLAHNWTFLLKTRGIFSFLRHKINKRVRSEFCLFLQLICNCIDYCNLIVLLHR